MSLFEDLSEIKKEFLIDKKINKKNIIKEKINLKCFIVFHNKIFDELYQELTDEEKSTLIMFAVNENIQKVYKLNKNYNVIEDYKLKFYDISLENKNYVQSAAMCHIYYNNLYKDLDYIGIFQYDMKFYENSINEVYQTLKENNQDTLFYVFKDELKKSFRFNNTAPFFDESSDSSIITLYNEYFNTNFTIMNFTEDNFILLHTFIIPKHTFEKMMKWFITIILKMDKSFDIKITGDRGSFTERVHAIFLYLEILQEKLKLKQLKVKEIWPLYKNQTTHIFYKDK